MKKKLVAGIFLSLLPISVFGLALNVGVAKAEWLPLNFTIGVTPETPTAYDAVEVTASFNTRHINLVVIFSPLLQSGHEFFAAVDIYYPGGVPPALGYEEETYLLGKLSEGSYSFSIDARVWNLETGMLLNEDSYSRSFTITRLIDAFVDIDPAALNLKSRGQWIKAYIELPEGYDVNNIDISTVRLNDEILAESHPTEIGDYDGDGIPDLMVKFSRRNLVAILSTGEATLTVTGRVRSTLFMGRDAIRVING